ncbi:MAG: hypothetical protein ACRD3F_07810, partial [Acidobacteriaceae bacterium]
AEVRRGAFQGAFMDFIQECANDARFRRLCPVSDVLVKRREPAELVLRFFAYSENYSSFTHDVSKFLDRFVVAHRNNFDRVRFQAEFDQVMLFVEKFFPAGFAKSKTSISTPRVRFEAISVGVNLALRQKPALVPASMGWLESGDFERLTTTHASNSGPRLRSRVEFVRDHLLGRGK